jgi:glycosyltransferase involved in cell wall biosynthesis
MDKVKILHNGVDIDLFDNSIEHACPADLTAIPRPRIANIGAINRKIDLTLVAEIAETRPEWHWVFIGKVIKQQLYEDIEATAAFEKCESLPNVHFLGEKNRLAIPAYAQHSDINVICYRIKEGEWVSAGYPLKLNEYLAVGKPVIASPMQAIKSHFSNYVSIASTKEEWIKAIELAQLQGGVGTPEQRKKIAGQNSWDNRVDSLEKWFLEEFS